MIQQKAATDKSPKVERKDNVLDGTVKTEKKIEAEDSTPRIATIAAAS
jgi:hypothetical protein